MWQHGVFSLQAMLRYSTFQVLAKGFFQNLSIFPAKKISTFEHVSTKQADTFKLGGLDNV